MMMVNGKGFNDDGRYDDDGVVYRYDGNNKDTENPFFHEYFLLPYPCAAAGC